MKRKIIAIVLHIMAGLLFVSAALAQIDSLQINQGTVTLATVNIFNAKIISQEKENIYVSFDLYNREAVQPGIKYAIQLRESVGDGYTVVDENVFDEVVNLGVDDTFHKEIVYYAPGFLTGEYEVWVVSENICGLILGEQVAGVISLDGSNEYVKIKPNKCSLKIAGDDGTYPLSQVVDVLSSEKLSLECEAENLTGKVVELSPNFEIRQDSNFGPAMQTASGEPLELQAGERKNISTGIPIITQPGLYSVTYKLSNEKNKPISNSIFFNYGTYGPNATIDNLILDKSHYSAGEDAEAKVSWRLPKDVSGNQRYGMVDLGEIKLSISIVNSKNIKCGKDVTKILGSNNTIERQVVEFPIQEECDNPTVTLALKGKAGEQLDEKIFKITTKITSSEAKGSKNRTTKVVLILLLLVMGLVVAGLYFHKRKNWRNLIKTTKVLLFLCIGMWAGGNIVKADTVVVYPDNGGCGCGGIGSTYTYTVNINKNSFNPGENLTATASGDGQVSAAFNGYFKTKINRSSFGPLTAPVQSNPGSYSVDFTCFGDSPSTTEGCSSCNAGILQKGVHYYMPYTVASTSCSCSGYDYCGNSVSSNTCNQQVCGSDGQYWKCTSSGFVAAGGSCNQQCSCSCNGYDYCGNSVSSNTCNQQICGGDGQYWKCTSSGFVAAGGSCSQQCFNAKYKCQGTSCVRDDVNGIYTTSNCDNKCVATAKYKCQGTSCVRDDVNGIYTTSNCDNKCVAGSTTVSGYVKKDTGAVISGVTIDLYNGNTGSHSYPTTNSSGYWSGTITTGQSYAARISSGSLPAGYSSISAIDNNWCLSGKDSYEYQVAGQMTGNCSSGDDTQWWDRDHDSNTDFKVTYPSSAAKYKCQGTSCVRDDVNGIYTTSNCDNKCVATAKYKCQGTSCVRDDVNGIYTTSNCDNKCVATAKYKCQGTSCVRDDVNGIYTTSNCDNKCVATAKYKCQGTSCVRDDVNGIYTTSNCDNKCVATAKYKCQGTSCVRDDVNGIYTTSNCNNMCSTPDHKYKCQGASCVQDDIWGIYSNTYCDNKCVATAKYKCQGTSCVRDDVNGIYTTSNCDNKCSVVADPSVALAGKTPVCVDGSTILTWTVSNADWCWADVETGTYYTYSNGEKSAWVGWRDSSSGSHSLTISNMSPKGLRGFKIKCGNSVTKKETYYSTKFITVTDSGNDWQGSSCSNCVDTCSTGPGCRSSLANGSVTTTQGSCCNGKSCYECNNGYVWNGTTCEAAPKYLLSVTKNGNGNGSVVSSPSGISCGSICSSEYESGKLVTLTPTAAEGSEFDGWTGCDSTSANNCFVTMSEARTVTARFKLKEYSVTVNVKGKGSGDVISNPVGISCSRSNSPCQAYFTYNTSVTLNTNNIVGSVTWVGDACNGSNESSCNLGQITDNKEITVIFDCLCTTGCEANTCEGKNCANTCGVNACPGTKDCGGNWHEVNP